MVHFQSMHTKKIFNKQLENNLNIILRIRNSSKYFEIDLIYGENSLKKKKENYN